MPMGCSTSHSNDENNDEDNLRLWGKQMTFMTSSLEKLLTSKNHLDLLKAYIKLDKLITEEENLSPSSIFGQAMSRRQQIKTYLQAALEIKTQNEILSEECSIFDLFTDLGIDKSPTAAAEHEEFIASVNRRAINQNTIKILNNMLQSIEEQIKNSSARINQLQAAYQQQDELLGQIFGEDYGSETEKLLEKESDTMRYYRDVLSIGVLQWEVCLSSVETAVQLLQKGVSLWKSIQNQPLEKKITLLTDTRNCFQEAILLVQTSEELLQDVQFPYCTTRELRGVSQATDYVFTDVLIQERYLHATEVYKNFLQRAEFLQEWIKQVLNSRLKRDLLEIENKISKSVKLLRNERIYLICKKLKIEMVPQDAVEVGPSDNRQTSVLKNYNDDQHEPIDFNKFPINLESKLGLSQQGNTEEFNVQNYFRRIMENRRNTMWPSRRIEELQSLAMQKWNEESSKQTRETQM